MAKWHLCLSGEIVPDNCKYKYLKDGKIYTATTGISHYYATWGYNGEGTALVWKPLKTSDPDYVHSDQND